MLTHVTLSRFFGVSAYDMDMDRLDRYWAGEGSAEERARAEAWLAEDAGRARTMAALRELKPSDRPVWNAQAGWGALMKDMETSVSAAPPAERQVRVPVGRMRKWTRWVMAGSVIATAALVVGILGDFSFTAQKTAADGYTYAALRGERLSVQLPDGSQVVLGPESHVVYRESGRGARTVTLQGQAFFTVAHDAKRLFSVEAAGTVTEVLGTAFSVRAYSEDESPRVAVTEGKVAFGRSGDNRVLSPGDIGRVVAGQVVVTHDARISEAVGWMQGDVTFDDTSLGDVARELERLYDVTIRFEHARLASRLVTASFSARPGRAMLDAITAVADVSYRMDGNVVTIAAR